MRRSRLRGFAGLAIVGCLVISGLLPGIVRAEDRPAELILAEIDSIEIPKLDPSRKGETEAMIEYLSKRKAAMARRGELTLELFRAYPDHPKLPSLFSERWQDRLGTGSNAANDPKLLEELDEVIARAKSATMRADAAFFKTIAELQAGQGGEEGTLKTVDKFIASAPKDERGAMLLFATANQMQGAQRQMEVFKRIVSEYPSSRYAGMATAAIRKQESVGKPFDLEFKDAISGSALSMKGLRGKVVVVDFWATWCGPCVEEMPKMKELYAQYRDQGVEFIGVSLDQSPDQGGLDKLKEFVSKNEITWPQYYQGNGWESAFSSSWGIEAIPAVFVIDQEGKLFSIDARGHLDEIIPELLKKEKPEKAGD